jgi:predicted Zn-dependent protease
MKLESRDLRALQLLGGALAVTALVYFWPAGEGDIVKPTLSSVPMAEKRLDRLREQAATVPAKQAFLNGIVAQLKTREKGLIEADTTAQAQAQLSQVVRKLMRGQSPPMEVDYGETAVTVGTNCRIEQLVNLLADLSKQPEAIATRDLRILAADPRQKLISVRLTVSAALPKRLVTVERRPTAGGNFF